MPQVWDREPTPCILSFCYRFWQILFVEQSYLKHQLMRQVVSRRTGIERS